MICFHGAGANYEIVKKIKNQVDLETTLVSFNFPDHDIQKRNYDLDQASFGTIQELLPALWVLKTYVIENKLSAIDLYGHSAGGGALINILAILNTSRFDEELRTIGIDQNEKEQILQAIQRGWILLDTPLKSIEEIIAFRGSTPVFEFCANQYRINDLRPIDSLQHLQGLTLNVLVYFHKADGALSNRDDHLYIELLKKANPHGIVVSLLGEEGTHSSFHPPLWESYSKVVSLSLVNIVPTCEDKAP